MLWVLAYVGCIVLVNVGFSYVPLVDLGPMGLWPPMSLLVGAIFVLRDFAQRAVGHWVLVAMLGGAGLSYLMADPFVAIASLAAFAASELADWIIYTATGRPFRERVLYSSAISTPIDSVVFLGLIGHLGIAGMLTMTLSKMVAAVIFWRCGQR